MLCSIVVPFAGVGVAVQETDAGETVLEADSELDSTAPEQPVVDDHSIDADQPTETLTVAGDPVRLDRILGEEYDRFGEHGVTSSNEFIYVTNGSDRLEAFDSTGEPVWSTTLDDPLRSAPVVHDGMVYVAVREDWSTDQLAAFDASDGSLQWASLDTAGVEVYSDVPPVFGEYLYAFDAGDESVTALEPANGSVVWERALDDPSRVELTADDDAVYVVDGDHVRAFDGSTGDTVWNRGDWLLSDEVTAQPTVGDGALYVTVDGDIAGAVYAFDTAGGVPLWRTPVPEEPDLAPVVWDGSVFVASGSSVHAFDPTTGERTAMSQTAGEIQALELGTQLYVASEDARAYSGPGKSLTGFDRDLSVVWATALPTMTDDPDRVAYPTDIATIGNSLYVTGITESRGTTDADHSLYVFEPTALTVDDVAIVDESAIVGESITLEATVSNHGDESETSAVTFEINSPLTPTYLDHETADVTVEAGETTTATLELPVTSSGTYEIIAFERGTGGLAADPRVGPASIDVGHANPDDDWTQTGYDAAGSHWNPNTTAPTGPLMESWVFEVDGPSGFVERNPILVEDDMVVVHNRTTVWGLDLESGDERWEYRVTVPEDADGTEEIGTHVVVDGVVYFGVSYSEGYSSADQRSRLYAIDLEDGTLIGDRHFDDRRINLQSLSTDDDDLFFTMRVDNASDDDHGDRYLWAVDSHDFGEQRTQYLGDGGEIKDRSQVLVVGDRLVIADGDSYLSPTELRVFDRSTLEPTDSWTFGDDEIRTMIADGETIYLSLNPDAGGVDQLHAIDPSDLSTEWQLEPDNFLERTSPATPTPYDQHRGLAATDDTLITATRGAGSSGDWALGHYGVDTNTGEVEWFEYTDRGPDTRENSQHPIVAADGLFYAGPQIYDAATGEHLVSSPTGFAVAVSDGTVLGLSGSDVAAFQEVDPISVSDLELSATELEHGEELEATIEVTNPTAHNQSIQVEMPGGWPRLETDDFHQYDTTLEPGVSETITFSETPRIGDHSIHAEVYVTTMSTVWAVDDYYTYHTTAPQTATVYEEPAEPTALEGVVVTETAISADSVTVGDEFTVTTTLQNLGTETVTESVEAAVGLDSTAESVTLDGGAHETVELPLRSNSADDGRAVTVNGLEVGTIDVGDTDLWIEYLTVDEPAEETGETAVLTATVYNYGDETVPAVLEFQIDGETLQTNTADVPPYYDDDTDDSVAVTFEHTFDEPGEYEALVVGDGVGVWDSPALFDVDLAAGSPPVAAFEYEPTAPAVGDEVTFDASASSASDGPIEAYYWDVTGDGSVDVTTTEPEAIWTYDEADAYDVSLEVEDGDGLTDETTETVTVAAAGSDLEVVDQYLSDDEIAVGENVTVTAIVENAGDSSGTLDLSVEFDGVSLYDEHLDLAVEGAAADGPVPVTVEAGETKTVDLEITFNEPMAPNPIGVNGGLSGYLLVDGEDGPGPEPPAQIVIDEPGVYTLDDHLSVDTTDAFVVIEADDVVFDGTGHTIENAAGSGTAVAAEHVENVTVRDLTLTNWQYGLQFETVEDALLEEITAMEIGQTGIWITEGTDSTVRHNELIENRDGIVVRASSTDTVVESNTVTESSRYGIAVRDSSANTLTNNDVVGAEDDGIFLTTGSSENTLVANTVTDSGSSWGDSGFHIDGDDNVLQDNVATGLYSEGYRISSDGNSLENSTARDSGREGFRLVDANDNVLKDVTAVGSDTHGVRVWNGFGNEFETVTAADNGGWDVFLSDGSQNNPVSGLTIGESVAETTLTADGTDVGLEGVETVPPAPDDALALDAYFVADDEGAGGSLEVELPYDVTDLGEIDEESLALWGYDDAAEAWSPVADSAVDTDEGIVTAELTSFSTFGVFGTPAVDFEVSDTTLNATTVETGTAVTIGATVENVGDTAGSHPVALEIGGEVVAEKDVSLEPGETDGLEFTHTFDDQGAFDVRVGGTDAGSVTVLEPTDVLVYGAAADRSTLFPGDTVTITADLYNSGIDGEHTATLMVDGEGVSEETVDVETGINRDHVELSWTPSSEAFPAEGESTDVSLTVDGFVVETVTLENAHSDIQVIAASTSETELIEGEETHVIGSIYQAGNVEGTEEIELTATHNVTGDTHVVDSQEATLSPGFYHLGAINITFVPEEPGHYDLELGGTNAGWVDVEEAETDIQVIAASTSEVELIEGEEAYTIGSVYQAGNVEGTETIELTATNTETNETTAVDSQEVTLSPGYYHLGALNITFEPEEAGTYDLELGDRPAGTVEVEDAISDIQVIAASTSEVELIEGEEAYTIGSVYQAGNVKGTETIELTATHVESDNTSVVGSQEVTLSPGYYHLGALNITFEPGAAGTYELTLGDRPAGTVEVNEAVSDIQVIAASISEVELIEGEEAYTIGSVYQAGNVEGTETIELTATNTETDETTAVDSQEVTLSPGYYHLGALNITFEPEEAGTYDLELGDRPAGTVEVEEAVSDIQVIAASPDGYNLTVGEEVNVIGSVYQAGNVEGTEEIELTATNTETNGTTTVGSQEVTLSPGYYHLGALNITFEPDEAGTYDLELGNRSAGSVSVEESLSDIQVVGASVEDVELIQGEQTHVIGSIYQAGAEGGTETIDLTATNTETNETEVVGSQDVALDPGFYHLGAINITFEPDEAGTYDLQLGGRDAGWVEVEEAVSDIQVIAASTSEIELIDGEEAYTIGSIYQSGNVEGTETIDLTATNTETNETEVVGSQDVTLSPGYYHLGALNVSFELDAGTYDLELGDRPAGTVEVEPAVSDIQVIAASTSEVELIDGEEAYTIGSVYQSGNIEGTETIELTATHTESGETTTVGSQDVTLEPGYYHLGALNISFQPDMAGTYDLELGERPAGTVEVEPAVSDIQVIAASTSDVEIALGQETYVIGSIYQAGTVEGTEEFELTATHDETGETEVVGSQMATLAPGFYHLGALNVTFEPDQTGTYTLELGDRTAGTVDVVEPTVDPSITDVAGHSSGYDLDLEADVVYASENTPVEIDIESDLDLESVTLLVSSLQTTYSISADAEHNGGTSWSVEVPVDDITDDGVYELSVVAVDAVGTGGFADASELLVIDREGPGTSVTLEDVDGEDATVVIESDEPLTGAPAVSAELVEPDGSTSDVPVTIDSDDGTGTSFTGTLEFDESGNYTVTVAGTDRAGNVGEDTASVVVNTAFTLGDGEIIVGDTGTSIAFDLIDDVDDAIATQELYVALSENSLNTDLDGGKLGVGFLTADLDDFINHQLGEEDGVIESATITMAADDGALPDGTDATDVNLYHYEGDSTWDPVDSDVIDVGGDPFVTATVPGFSTYGALVADEQDPVVTSVSPSDGSTLTAGTDETTVRFEYEDDLSGIDVGAVTLTLDGTDVTTTDGTQITSAYAEHTFTVGDGDSHTVTVTVVDQAGNDATATTSFTVQDDSSSSPALPPSPSPDPEDGVADDDSTDDSDEKADGSDDGPAETDDDSTAKSDDGDADAESDDSIPGFGLVIALVVLLAAALFRTR